MVASQRHLFPSEALADPSVQSTSSKFLIIWDLPLSLTYLKSICVFSSQAESLIPCMKLVPPKSKWPILKPASLLFLPIPQKIHELAGTVSMYTLLDSDPHYRHTAGWIKCTNLDETPLVSTRQQSKGSQSDGHSHPCMLSGRLNSLSIFAVTQKMNWSFLNGSWACCAWNGSGIYPHDFLFTYHGPMFVHSLVHMTLYINFLKVNTWHDCFEDFLYLLDDRSAEGWTLPSHGRRLRTRWKLPTVLSFHMAVMFLEKHAVLCTADEEFNLNPDL